MSLSVWCFLLGGLILAEGVSGLVAPQTMTKLFRAFPRNVWAGWILCAIAWIWSGYAINSMGLDFLVRFRTAITVLSVVCIFLTCWWLDNLLSCRAWGGILCLFPYELLHVARVHMSPWRLVVVSLTYVLIVWGMTLILYPWKMRDFITWTTATPLRLRAVSVIKVLVGTTVAVLGATVLA